MDACETATSDQLDALVGPDPRFRFVAHRAVSDPLLLRRLVKLKGK